MRRCIYLEMHDLQRSAYTPVALLCITGRGGARHVCLSAPLAQHTCRMLLDNCTFLHRPGARGGADGADAAESFELIPNPTSCAYNPNINFCTGLEHVAELTALTALNLRECRLVTNDGLRRLEPLVQLKSFSMSNCTSVTDKGLQSLAKLTGAAGELTTKVPLAVARRRWCDLRRSPCPTAPLSPIRSPVPGQAHRWPSNITEKTDVSHFRCGPCL